MIVFTGRTLAYSSNARRSATLIERWPLPTGVASGPFRATPVARMDSMTGSGAASPRRSTAIVARRLLIPGELHARRVQHLQRRGGDLGADPVARNQRHAVGHAGA